MKRSIVCSRSRRPLLALGLTVGVLVLFKLFGVMVYDTNDDAIMASVSYGYYGAPESWLVYVNVVLGSVYKLLQGLIPGVSWYYLGELGILAVSMTVLYWLALEKGKEALPELAVLTALFVHTMLFRLQYTKIAGCAAAAGILLLLDTVKRQCGLKGVLLGLLLALSGFCLRDSAFFMVLILLGGPVVWQFVCFLRAAQWKQVGKFVAVFLLLFALCAGLFFADRAAYSSPEWEHYRHYNALRTELMDYGFPDYEENRQLYEELGISESDLALYKSWDFGDTERFTVETMERLCQVKKSSERSVGAVLRCGKGAVEGLVRYDFAACLLAALLLCLICCEKRELWLVAWEVVVLAGVETLLLMNGRGLRERVDAPMVLTVTAMLLYLSSKKREKRPLDRRCCAALAAMVILSQIPGFFVRKDEAMERYVGGAHLQSAYRVLASDNSKFYFTRTDELPPDLLPGKWGGVGYYANIGQLGGWLTESPYVRTRNEAYGITNPYRDMVDSDTILLMSNDVEPVLRYIQDHYAPEARAIPEGKVNGEYDLWRFVSK